MQIKHIHEYSRMPQCKATIHTINQACVFFKKKHSKNNVMFNIHVDHWYAAKNTVREIIGTQIVGMGISRIK